MNIRHLCCFRIVVVCATLSLAGDERSAGLLKQADHLSDLYNWADAGPIYAKAEQSFRATGDLRDALYAKFGRLRGSMETLNLPEMSDDLGVELRTPLLQQDLRLRLMCLSVKGDIDGEIDSAPALADWQEALDVAKRLSDAKWQSRATGELGMNEFVRGNIAEARQRVGGALVQAFQSADLGAQIRYLSAIGTALALGRMEDQGISYLDKAIALSKKNPDAGYPFLATAGKIQALINKRDYLAASTLIVEAEQEARSRNKAIKLDELLLFKADISLAQGELGSAIVTLNEAAALASRNQARLFTDSQIKLAEAYRRAGDLAKAVSAGSAAVAGTGNSNDLYLAPARLRILAELEVARGHRERAADLYQRATDIIEGMVSAVPDRSARAALLAEMSPVFVGHFNLAATLNRSEEAFAIIEQVRGRIVVDSILSSDGESESVADMQTEDRIRRLKFALIKADGALQRRTLLNQLFVAEQARWTVLRSADENASLDPTPDFTLESVQRALPRHQVVLEYVLGETASYCLVVDRSMARLVKLAPEGKIESLVATYLSIVRGEKSSQREAHSLYRALIRPLALRTPGTSFVIVPDGILHLLPFAALIDDSGIPLVQSHTIWYSPSAATSLILKRRPRLPVPKLFLGIGGVQYGEQTLAKADWSLQRSAYYDVDPSKLPDLPGTTEEVQDAADILGAESASIRVGTEATETAFKASGVDRFRILHLAVHGIANAKNPDRAALVFRPNPPVDDGFLEPREILRLRLNADLVVLSACETAVGHLQGEEGIANIARAFLAVGARSVISTLWPIDDTYSLFLMKRFYTHLRNGDTTAHALQRSQLDVLEKFGPETPPGNWAAFTLLGEGNSAIFPKATQKVLTDE